MINIKTIWIEKTRLQAIYVSGHSQFETNPDPVCLAVSTVILGAINAIVTKKIDSKTVEYKQMDGYGHIKQIHQNDFLTNLLFVIFVQLKTIQKQYPQSIEFEKLVD